MGNLKHFLARRKNSLEWIHIGATLLLMSSPLVMLSRQGVDWRFSNLLLAFVLCLIGFAQNIGLVHWFAHKPPAGPRRLGVGVARLMHVLGGLSYDRATTAHRFHHLYLGTPKDPDRHGYDETTRSFFQRVLYLGLIGPLRAKYAPVELKEHINSWPPAKRDLYRRNVRFDRALLIVIHSLLLAAGGWSYAVLFGALIFANVLSNVREMTEHGNQGSAALVNIKPSLTGLLFLSTPGFWYHGIHHDRPEIHYWELPLNSGISQRNLRIPMLHRSSYLRFLLTGH